MFEQWRRLRARRSTGAGVEETRVVPVCGTAELPFRGNYASTTKYTLISYLPKALFEQYRRVANIFFTLMAAMSLTPWSPVRPWTTWTPLVLVVGVSMIKEAREDFKRHQQDQTVNSRPAEVLDAATGTFVTLSWRRIRVGDLLRIRRDEPLPADVVLLASSNPEGSCYVETMNLDGETNLKIRAAPTQTRALGTAPEQLRLLAGGGGGGAAAAVVECEAPNSRLYVFNGVLRLRPPLPPVLTAAAAAAAAGDKDGGGGGGGDAGVKAPGLQGGREGGRKSAAAAAVLAPAAVPAAAGKLKAAVKVELQAVVSERAARGDAGGGGFGAAAGSQGKRGSTEPSTSGSGDGGGGGGGDGGLVVPLSASSLLLRGCSVRNTDCVYGVVVYAGHDTKIFMNSTEAPSKRSTLERSMDRVIVAVFVLLFFWCLVSAGFSSKWTSDHMQQHWYLRPDAPSPDNDPNSPWRTGTVNFFIALLLYSYLVPISLYVSLEMVKVFQANVLIAGDAAMYHEETDTPALARTSNLNEELGMVGAILTDKTGTLTRNVMEFFKCSIGGVAYGAGITEVERTNRMRQGSALEEVATDPRAAAYRERYFNFYDERLLGGAWMPSPTTAITTTTTTGGSGGSGGSSGTARSPSRGPQADPEIIEMFFRLLAVCHTVIPEGPPDPATIKYEAESPDEAALVVAAKVFGFFFHRRTATSITVRERGRRGAGRAGNSGNSGNSGNGAAVAAVRGAGGGVGGGGGGAVDVEYDILAVLEFNSTRKRMSVVVRDKTSDKILLFTKGADTVIYERLDPSYGPNEAMKESTGRHMEDFGAAGLRTLCLSYAEVDREWYDNVWQPEYVAAKTSLVGRDEKVAEVSEKIERNLRLLGCTAIEDKLQEGVPECIKQLALAGIRIWVLTGDKMETAINIGYACSLLREDMMQHSVSASSPRVDALEAAGCREEAEALAADLVAQQLTKIEASLQLLASADTSGSTSDGAAAAAAAPQDAAAAAVNAALVIDGRALSYALAPGLAPLFLRVGLRCAAVVCCRVSPLQKAQVTGLVRGSGSITLAIGDGANDVGMIQRAHIGVGISGQEGMQAVMSSDFAIAQFRFLVPLLLVHGQYSYRRLARMINFFFYKNLLFGLTLFVYSAFTTFSGSYVYNDTSMTLFNVLFTSAAPLLIGMFDRPLSKRALLAHPQLYKEGVANADFSTGQIAGWLAAGALQAGVLLAMVLAGASGTAASGIEGIPYGMAEVGAVLFTVVLLTVHLHLAVLEEEWTWMHHAAIWGSLGMWFLYLLYFGALPVAWSVEMWKLFLTIVGPSPLFWLLCGLLPVAVAVLPVLAVREFQRLLFPSDSDIVREMGALERRRERQQQQRQQQQQQQQTSQQQQQKSQQQQQHQQTSLQQGQGQAAQQGSQAGAQGGQGGQPSLAGVDGKELRQRLLPPPLPPLLRAPAPSPPQLQAKPPTPSPSPSQSPTPSPSGKSGVFGSGRFLSTLTSLGSGRQPLLKIGSNRVTPEAAAASVAAAAAAADAATAARPTSPSCDAADTAAGGGARSPAEAAAAAALPPLDGAVDRGGAAAAASSLQPASSPSSGSASVPSGLAPDQAMAMSFSTEASEMTVAALGGAAPPPPEPLLVTNVSGDGGGGGGGRRSRQTSVMGRPERGRPRLSSVGPSSVVPRGSVLLESMSVSSNSTGYTTPSLTTLRSTEGSVGGAVSVAGSSGGGGGGGGGVRGSGGYMRSSRASSGVGSYLPPIDGTPPSTAGTTVTTGWGLPTAEAFTQKPRSRRISTLPPVTSARRFLASPAAGAAAAAAAAPPLIGLEARGLGEGRDVAGPSDHGGVAWLTGQPELAEAEAAASFTPRQLVSAAPSPSPRGLPAAAAAAAPPSPPRSSSGSSSQLEPPNALTTPLSSYIFSAAAATAAADGGGGGASQLHRQQQQQHHHHHHHHHHQHPLELQQASLEMILAASGGASLRMTTDSCTQVRNLHRASDGRFTESSPDPSINGRYSALTGAVQTNGTGSLPSETRDGIEDGDYMGDMDLYDGISPDFEGTAGAAGAGKGPGEEALLQPEE
ncbi:hypothetical protein PLESTM_001843200 [Pleodorina starrii]|nr:hypothetical protein PLESTM_001843200 [Pleodorina starrii]